MKTPSSSARAYVGNNGYERWMQRRKAGTQRRDVYVYFDNDALTERLGLHSPGDTSHD